MDSQFMTGRNISNISLVTDNSKLDQQQIINRSNNSSLQNNRRASSNSGESDVDSGIVAVDHTISKTSSSQLQTSTCNSEINSSLNRLNQIAYINQIDQNINQKLNFDSQIRQTNSLNNLNNYLNLADLKDTNAIESEKLRSSCIKVLAKINTAKQMSTDAIYANINTINTHQKLSNNLVYNSFNKINFSQSSADSNQYAVPILINCDCLNCKLNKKDKKQINSSPNLQNHLYNNEVLKSDCFNKCTVVKKQDFIEQQRVNQEDIKRLLLEALRQKNLEKELLEQKEKQLHMYLQERQKIIEKSMTCDFKDLTLEEKTKIDQKQTYQNLPNFQQKDKSDKIDFTKSCVIKPTIDKNAIEDELITKSFNGGYCSQETRKVLEGSNLRKRENKSFLQKFSFKFSKAFTKAFNFDKTDSEIINKADSELTDKKVISLSNKTIEKNDAIKEFKNKNCENLKKTNFDLNLDEYCIIKKPSLTPKKSNLIENERSKKCKHSGSIRKRSSVNRKHNSLKSPYQTKIRNVQKTEIIQENLKNNIEENVTAELIEINKDGSQVIELKKPDKKHFGFFVARGKVKNVNGVYVSRMKDEETKRLLSGLVEIGDEIIAIDNTNVKNSSIIEVNYLMANKCSIKLHVMPYTKS